jgi:hypothetical protein
MTGLEKKKEKNHVLGFSVFYQERFPIPCPDHCEVSFNLYLELWTISEVTEFHQYPSFLDLKYGRYLKFPPLWVNQPQ